MEASTEGRRCDARVLGSFRRGWGPIGIDWVGVGIDRVWGGVGISRASGGTTALAREALSRRANSARREPWEDETEVRLVVGATAAAASGARRSVTTWRRVLAIDGHERGTRNVVVPLCSRFNDDIEAVPKENVHFIACVDSLRRSRKSPGHLGLLRLPPFDEPRLRNRVRLHRGRMTQHANAAASEYPPTRTALVLHSSPFRPPESCPSTFKPPSLCSARILSIRAGASSMPSVRWMSPRVPSVVAWVPEPRVRIPEPPRITDRER